MQIYSYQKISDDYTTYTAQGSEESPVQELCTIDGTTYFYGPDELPPQPEKITVVPVVLTEELRTAIKAASPMCQLSYRRTKARIRERYSQEDETFLARIGVGQALGVYQMSPGEMQELADYQAFVEEQRAWGREQRELIGL
ncbi:hypothetical protein GW820_02395 [archaeon]|nr:hypothetical protein [archaeon]